MFFFERFVFSGFNCIEQWLICLKLLFEELQDFIGLQLSHQDLYLLAESFNVLLGLLEIEDAHHLPPVFLHEISPLLLLIVEVFYVFEVVFIGVDIFKLGHFIA